MWLWLAATLSGQICFYNKVKQHLPTFSKIFITEVFFPFIFPKDIKIMSALKIYKPWTKPISYEVNHKITNFDFKQKSIWKSDRKTKVCVL